MAGTRRFSLQPGKSTNATISNIICGLISYFLERLGCYYSFSFATKKNALPNVSNRFLFSFQDKIKTSRVFRLDKLTLLKIYGSAEIIFRVISSRAKLFSPCLSFEIMASIFLFKRYSVGKLFFSSWETISF